MICLWLGDQLLHTNLGKFAATVEPAHLKTEIMQIFEDLTQDDQDSDRLIAVEGSLGKLLEPQDCFCTYSSCDCYLFSAWPHIVPCIDKSWRVRYMVANQLYELCEAVGPEPTKYHNEAEVRIAAVGKVTKFSRILSPELAVQHILPCVKDSTIDQLLHMFLSLQKDEFLDVRLNIISKLDQVYSIREAAANNLKRLAEEFGPCSIFLFHR
ncbi:putative armadillo-like helical protein [Helianthus debilis subsp. tardiflorus]